ncbi:late embryogenesis abundant protein D-34-like [Typha angustifolia]|uniref:late embryogenesis abundant protein D-34-like n=1 Tax=Typha angustifolia TaxID=59011 RepID=UPI003C2E0A22
MSQRQPSRSEGGDQKQKLQGEAIKYGDVFNVTGDLADQPIAPKDAALMQSAENLVLGQTQKGGPAAVMQSAATINERAGAVGRDQYSSSPGDEGVSVTETDLPGRRVITEYVAGHIVGQYVTPTPVTMRKPAGALEGSAVTIGEALEAAALSVGGKPVDQSDAAAIQAAEIRATGHNLTIPGGIAATAQAAADANTRVMPDDLKTKIADVLSDATAKLPADKGATKEDAERVVGAEIRNKPDLATTPGGVAASVTAAARFNQERQ